MHPPLLSDVYAARQRISDVIRPTPLLSHALLAEETGLDIRVKHEEEAAAGKAHWIELFTGPKMFYRTVLGIVLQAGQQLTGANFVSIGPFPWKSKS